jgi:hypothetical protein
MAAFEQPRAGGSGYNSISGDASGNKQMTSMSSGRGKATGRLKWTGSVVGGVLIGAVAALLIAGILGTHETGVGTVKVSDSSAIQSSTNQ